MNKMDTIYINMSVYDQKYALAGTRQDYLFVTEKLGADLTI